MVTVRRHLGRGPHKGHWQIRGYVKDYKQGEVIEYVNPETHSIVFHGCRLHNSVATATRIINGSGKEPCAWIIAESYEIIELPFSVSNPERRIQLRTDNTLSYNPRQAVTWMLNGSQVADDLKFNMIITSGTSLQVVI